MEDKRKKTMENNLNFEAIEKQRIEIVKEIGYSVSELKNSVSSLNKTSFTLKFVMFLLSLVCSFAITNFLLGLQVENSASVVNLTTNIGFLIFCAVIVFSISLILSHGVFLGLDNKKNQKESTKIQKTILFCAFVFMFLIYIINLFYYKDIPNFKVAAFFIALLFAGGLTTITVACGFVKAKLKEYNSDLMKNEYRPDFESVLKSYAKCINKQINALSQNKIANAKEGLLNNQFKMIVETIVGILTAPFLAYGVSNTLALCFPEAASWIRISGIRFSPIFLVLATFLIIFAFFSFVKAFSISKNIKSSEIIKFDGYHDFKSHGVTILGLDAIRTLNKEKNIAFFIACFIILIEFTMNVSYFISEIGNDFQGFFLSIVTALVPTALLIAETHLLSSTLNTINNYSDMLSNLD